MTAPVGPPTPLLGLRTVLYPAPDLPVARAAATALLGVEPYFDTDFSVGYDVGRYEFALDPHGDPAAGPVVYWGVRDVDRCRDLLIERGAIPIGPVQDVGDGIRTAAFRMTGIHGVLGVIENPHFSAEPQPSGKEPGSGR